ncbi:MAG: phage tail tape measure protein [Asticcacaulis sp.]
MNNSFSSGPLGGIDQQISETSAALKALEGPATESAEAIDQAFAKAGQSLSRSLGRAASDGKISLKELASALLNAVNSAAGASVSGGLGSVLSQVFSAVQGGFSGARADGGFVGAGGSYLVGERGPEIFRPNVSGQVEAKAAQSPNINVTVMMSGGPQALVRSEAQLATSLQRAARLGLRG